jgi:protease-4
MQNEQSPNENQDEQKPSGASSTNTRSNIGKESMREIEELLALMRQERRYRVWDVGFRIVKYAIVLTVVVAILYKSFAVSDHLGGGEFTGSSDGHIAMVRIEGVIDGFLEASGENIIDGLHAAVSDLNTKMVVLVINSPGGSPVQAGVVYDEIMHLREDHPNTEIVSLIGDIGASGAYYIAAATSRIYANRASLVGSIGVIASGFGYKGLLEKIGVERRVYTAGKHKGFLDPFVDENSEQARAWKQVLESIHEQFLQRVTNSRGKLIKDKRAYSGLLWSGEQAHEVGLVDALGDMGTLARDYDIEEVVDFTVAPSYFDSFIEDFAESIVNVLSRQKLQLLLPTSP